MVVTLPASLLLLDWWPLPRGPATCARGAIAKAPHRALGRGERAHLPGAAHRGPVASLEAFPIGPRLANALLALRGYSTRRPGPPIWRPSIRRTAFPRELSPAALLALISGARAPRAPAPSVPPRRRLWFLGTASLPVLGLVQVGEQAMADRYTYLPHIGLLVMVAWAAAELPAAPRAARLGAAAGVPPRSRRSPR